MSLPNKGLGRGLEALFHGGQNTLEPAHDDSSLPFMMVSLENLVPNRSQPRTRFTDESISELAESIREQGILQPVLARECTSPGKYEIIAGERRWRAAKQAGVDCIPVIIKNLDDNESMIVALMENIQREDLNPLEQARALMALKNALGISQEALADKLGKPRGTISNFFRLLRLDEAAQQDLVNERITAGHARCLLSLPPGEIADELRQRIIEKDMTVRETEAAVDFWHSQNKFPWTQIDESGVAPREKQLPNPDIVRLAKQIGATLNCRTQIRGTSEKGRISLAYDSNAQLFELLDRLGLTLTNMN